MMETVDLQVHLKSSGYDPTMATRTERPPLTIGELAERTGVATSALRFYESEGLIASTRTDGGQRRFAPVAVRRVSFIRIAQQVGIGLDEVRAVLAKLPDGRTPTRVDWARVSRSWAPSLDARLATLQRIRADLANCIGCGCLSLTTCALYNPDDAARAFGTGPRYLLGDPSVQPRCRTGRS
jgi:MerR family redox-sensitive transcriptional activator SoxR